MSPADHMTPAAYAAAAFEIALFFGGIALLLWLFLSARGREHLAVRITPWNLPPVDFACYAFASIVGFVALSALAGLVLRHVHLDADFTKVLGGAVQDVGLLLGIGIFHHVYHRKSGGTGPSPAGLRALRTGEDIDIDVSRPARFERAIAERDRTSDRVGYLRRVERVVNGEQLIAELAHERSRISGGYSSFGRGRYGSEAARSSTCERTLPACSVAGSSAEGVISSSRPAPCAMRPSAATDGCRRPCA